MNQDDISEARPDGFPRLLPSLIWIAAYFVLQILISTIAIGIAMALNPALAKATASGLDDTAKLAAAAVPILWALVVSGVVLISALWLYLRKSGRATAIGLTHGAQIPFAEALGLGIVLIASAMGFNYLYANYIIPGVKMQGEMSAMLGAVPDTPVNLVMRFAAVALIAPLVEELLFRGLLQNALMRHMRPMAAIVVAAIIFAAVHLQLYATPALMVAGAVFGFLYYRTGSLRTTIALHMANNALGLLLLS